MKDHLLRSVSWPSLEQEICRQNQDDFSFLLLIQYCVEFATIWGSLEVGGNSIWIGSSVYRKGLLFLAAFQAHPFTLGIVWTFCLHMSISRTFRVLGGKPVLKVGLFFSEKSLNSSIA